MSPRSMATIASIARVGQRMVPDAAAPPAISASAEGTGIPTASARTIRKTTRYPCWTMSERVWLIWARGRLACNMPYANGCVYAGINEFNE